MQESVLVERQMKLIEGLAKEERWTFHSQHVVVMLRFVSPWFACLYHLQQREE